MRLSVVIPSRGGSTLLARHLPEIARQLRALPGGGEVLVVDDASERSGDGEGSLAATRRVVAAIGPPVRLLAEPTHQGFAGTCNRGAQAAHGEFLFFFNSDMHPEPSCFERCLARLADDDTLFAVSPRVLNLAIGRIESVSRFAWTRGALDLQFVGRDDASPAPGNDEQSIAYACGGAFVCRRDRFLELGGFCELLAPFYWEDAELGLRAWEHGWAAVELPSAAARHEHAQTIGARYSPREVKRVYERNRLLTTWIHLRGPRAWGRHLGWLGLRWGAALLRGRPLAGALLAAIGRVGGLPRARRRCGPDPIFTRLVCGDDRRWPRAPRLGS
jgi:GT2 family glycosyltransferase